MGQVSLLEAVKKWPFMANSNNIAHLRDLAPSVTDQSSERLNAKLINDRMTKSPCAWRRVSIEKGVNKKATTGKLTKPHTGVSQQRKEMGKVIHDGAAGWIIGDIEIGEDDRRL